MILSCMTLEMDRCEKFTALACAALSCACALGISLAAVDLSNIEKINHYKKNIYTKIDSILEKYKTVKSIKVNEKSTRGGFFNGYPFLIENNENLSKIINIFQTNNLKLSPYPWLMHHKMNLYFNSNINLDNTENIADKVYFIQIPYFLNFNFKNLENSLSECKKNSLIN